jgi:hypothetical protein
MAKQSKGRRAVVAKKNDNRHIWLIVVPALAFFIKMIVMANTAKGGWLGADGENYLSGVDGLLADGFFSKKQVLTYWPAGYPLFIWPLVELSINNFLFFLSFIQSIFFAYATFFFTSQLLKLRLSFLAVLVSVTISFNPTLSLSTNVVGYESLISSLLLISVGLLIRSKTKIVGSISLKYGIASMALLGVATFLQPRFILSACVLLLIYSLILVEKRARIKFVAFALLLLMAIPGVLIARNVVSNNLYAIATELGATMNIGAGEKVSGGYGAPDGTIECAPKPPATSATSNEVVVCVLKWYLTHPAKTAKLVVSKSVFYWSPWSGPIANGTMARNPWLKINPIMDITKTQEGRDLVYGPFGKTVSWLWIIGQLVLLFSGLIWLWKMGGSEKLLAKLVGAPVLLGWLISTGTIGDHRFRIPQMGLSLFLQVAGFYALRKRLSVATIAPTLEASTKAR